MWKYHNVEITPGKGFVDTNGVRHPVIGIYGVMKKKLDLVLKK